MVVEETEFGQRGFLLWLSPLVALVSAEGAIAETSKFAAELLLLVFGLTWFG